MTTHVIDTNIVLRFMLADHEQHFQAASALLTDLRTGKRKAYTAESVAAECVFVLTQFYTVPKDVAAEKSSALMHYKGFTGAHMPVLKAALAIFAMHTIAFVDAVTLAMSRSNRWELETLD